MALTFGTIARSATILVAEFGILPSSFRGNRFGRMPNRTTETVALQENPQAISTVPYFLSKACHPTKLSYDAFMKSAYW